MRRLLLALALLLGAASPVTAQQQATGARRVQIGPAIPRVLDQGKLTSGFLAVRFAPRFLSVSPMVGVVGGALGEVFAFGGVYRELPVGSWVLTPAFSGGAYDRGRGRHLGSALEFRSSLEVARKLGGGTRIGVEVSHTSNGGLGWRNPGRERLLMVLSLPF